MAFCILLATFLTHALCSKHDLRSLSPIRSNVYVIVGLILGKALLHGWFYICGIELTGGRISYLKNHFINLVPQWKAGWPYILWSLIGIWWFLIIGKIRRLWPVLLAALFAFFVVLTTSDQTRVGSITLFPVIFWWVLKDKELWHELNMRWVITLVVFYLTLPIVFVFGGIPYGSLWKYDLEIIIQMAQGDFWRTPFDWFRPFHR